MRWAAPILTVAMVLTCDAWAQSSNCVTNDDAGYHRITRLSASDADYHLRVGSATSPRLDVTAGGHTAFVVDPVSVPEVTRIAEFSPLNTLKQAYRFTDNISVFRVQPNPENSKNYLEARNYTTTERYAGEQTAFRVGGTGCNTVVFAQWPDDQSLFLGRQMVSKSGGQRCDGNSWQIVLDRFDWEEKRFKLVHPIITPPITIEGGRRLLNAYDPDVVKFHGQYWMAFECVGENIPGTSTCMARLQTPDVPVEPSTIYVAIEGETEAPGPQYTAAEPKLLEFRDRLYLYWTAIKKIEHKWVSLATRGTELRPDGGAPTHMWVNGKNEAASAYDSSTNVEVWGDADVFSVREINNSIYAISGAAQAPCLTPDGEYDRCFSIQISRSPDPLRPAAFAETLADPNLLPTTGGEYARFFVGQSHQLFIIGHFVPHIIKSFKQRPIPEGLTVFPINLDKLFEN